MSRWTRTFVAISIVLTAVLVHVPVPGARAQTQGTSPQILRDHLAALQGRIVFLVRHDGTWLQVRILRVYSILMVVELADGTQGTVSLASIDAVRDRRPEEPPPSSSSPGSSPRSSPGSSLAEGAKKLQRKSVPHTFRVEWVGLRFGVGGELEYGDWSLAGFAELTLFGLHWRHFYWEILRIGGGKPHLFHWGTAFGYPIHFGVKERHELRIGVHISFWMGTLPTLSGVQITYHHRPTKKLALQVGVMQTSYPFSIIGTLGFSM